MCIFIDDLLLIYNLQRARVDNTDLQIVRLLARDSRTSYKNIASVVGLTQSATRKRINKMVSNGVIKKFVVITNPAILGYEKLCLLMVKNIEKTTKAKDLLKRVSLLGDVISYTMQLEGSYIFVLYVRNIGQDKIAVLSDLLKPAILEAVFAAFRPPTMRIYSSDFKIMKWLLSDARMPVEDIAKETSLSTKTVRRRLEKMKENLVLHFSILPNLSSMKLTGYIQFVALIHVKATSHQSIAERIYRELEEYLLYIPNWYQREVNFALFLCGNISTVNLIIRKLESYDGVKKVEFFIMSDVTIDQNLFKSGIDKRITS